VTLRLVDHPSLGEVEAQAWGEGAEWMLDRLPALLGEDDDDGGFVAHHDVVAEARRRFDGWRVPASGLVVQALIPTIIEQRVTGEEAFAAYRMLVRNNGTPAPGIGADLRLVVPPEPRTWALIPSWEWLRAGVDGARSRPAVTVATRAGRLEETVGMPWLEARRRIESLPGVGRWSSAEVAQRALGDHDAVSFGDYHVAKNIGWALTGTPVNDDGLAELLEPYAGHRYRVQRLLELAGAMRPRRGPRFTLPTHLPGRS
jgi:3-methyladenine DNA glycosylase/8-oxoguanine DNA glycosylase